MTDDNNYNHVPEEDHVAESLSRFTDDQLLDALQRRFDTVVVGCLRRVNTVEGGWAAQTYYRFTELEPYQACGFSYALMNKLKKWNDERFTH